MKTILRSHSLALCLLATVACGKSETTAPTQEPTTTDTSVESAQLAPGDLVPRTIFPVKLDVSQLAAEKLSASFAASPNDKIAWTIAPRVEVSKAALVVVPQDAPEGNRALAIDAPQGASITLVPKVTDVYDKALRDLQVYEPSGRMRIDGRLAKLDALTSSNENPMATIDLADKSAAGLYIVKVGPVAAKSGVAIWANLPQSKIALEIAPSAFQAFPGEKATAKLKLTDDGVPVLGASLEGTLEGPDGSSRPLSFNDVGGGNYEALVSDAIGSSGVTGFYDIKVRAKGVSNSVKFDRFASTSLQWVVPTGKILSVSAPRTVTDAAGLIEAFDIDVKIESATTDRFEVNGALALQMTDGTERPLVVSQTAETLTAGKHTITLRFEAGYLGLAKLEGPVVLRTLSLYSQGSKATLQRHLKGLEIRLPALNVAKIAPLKNVAPSVDELIQTGGFELK